MRLVYPVSLALLLSVSCKPVDNGTETQSRQNQTVGEVYDFSTKTDRTVFIFDSAIGNKDAAKVIPKGIAENQRCTLEGKRTIKAKFISETRKGILRTILNSKQYVKVEVQDWGGVPCREKVGYLDTSTITESTTPSKPSSNKVAICRKGTPAEDRVCGNFSELLRKECKDLGMGDEAVCGQKQEWSKAAYQKIQGECIKSNAATLGSGLIYAYEKCAPTFETLQREGGTGDEEKTYVNERIWVCTATADADSVCGVFTPEEVAACRALDGGDVCGTAEDQKNRVERRWGKAHYYKVLDKLKGK